MTNTVSTLPRIVQFLGTSDAGEFSAADCPHCGAKGRYVHSFVAADRDGNLRRLGAMSGCIKLFPVAPIAKEHAKVSEALRAKAAKGWKPASWDTAIVNACEAFYAGTLTEDQAMGAIQGAKYDKAEWMRRKGFRR